MLLRWNRERAVGLGLLAICAALWFYLLPTYVEGADARFFPRLITAWLALFSLLTTIFPPRAADAGAEPAEPDRAPIPAGRTGDDAGAPSVDAAATVEEERYPSVYGLMVVWAIYVLVIEPLGFYVATFLMLMSSMFYLGIRNVVALLLRPALALLVIYLLLDVALNFRLPDAIWQ